MCYLNGYEIHKRKHEEAHKLYTETKRKGKVFAKKMKMKVIAYIQKRALTKTAQEKLCVRKLRQHNVYVGQNYAENMKMHN